jgi:ribosome-associated toxin RatA of RatAB toxin-antitoxin module
MVHRLAAGIVRGSGQSCVRLATRVSRCAVCHAWSRLLCAPAHRGRVLAFVLASLFVWSQAGAAATVAVTAERHGDGIEIQASALLEADAATAWIVLTDYDRYVEFIPDLRESRVVSRHGGTVRVEQSGDAMLWLLRLPMRMTFEITEIPPYGLESRAVSGTLRALRSRYVLVPSSSGVRLDYVGLIAPGFELFGPIEQVVVEQNVTRQFQALADEIERRSNGVSGRNVTRP